MRDRPTRLLPYLLAFVLGAGGAVLTACGSENPAMIPLQNANRLKSDLDEVVAAVDATDCARADKGLAQVAADIASLPARTSVRLKHRLDEALAKLREQSDRECQEETNTETTDTTTTETTDTTTETTDTTTQTIPTTTTDTTATVPTTTDSIPTTPTTTDSIPPTDTSGDTGGAVTP